MTEFNAQQKIEQLSVELSAAQQWIQAIENAGDGIWDWNVITGAVLYSRRWKELLGYQEDEIGSTRDEWLARIHPEDQRKVYSLINAVMEGVQSEFVSEYRLKCRDGSWKWLLTRARVTRDAGGMAVRLAGVNTDLTMRHEREMTLQEELANARRLNDTLDYIPTNIYIKNKDHQYIYGNSAILEMFNISDKDLAGSLDARFFPPETVARVWEVDERVLKHGEITREEIEVSPGSPDWHVSLEIKTPIYDQDGEIWGLCGVSTNITERKRAEAEIQELNEALETRVKERTAQLELANQELTSLTNSMAHSLKTPLRALDGFSYILLEDYSHALDEKGKEYLNRIRSASHRMWQVTDDLLELLSITRVELKLVRVDLGLMAKEIIRSVKIGHPERQVEFICQDGLMVEADLQMTQVLMEHLLGNAWKFTRERQPARIELGSLDREGQTIFFVRDNGVGMDMAYIQNLFGVFQRLHAADAFEGNGVGLAMVQRILQRHGGSIWAEGMVNQGATFYFKFR